MDDPRQNNPFLGPITPELVRDYYPRSLSTATQQLTKEADCRESITLRLDQDVDHGTLLIDGSPQGMLYSVDLEKHLVQVPFVAELGAFSLQIRCVRLAELIATT